MGGKAAGAIISHQSLLTMAKLKHEWNLSTLSWSSIGTQILQI